MVLLLIALGRTDGASVAVDSKEPISETGSDGSNNRGIAEEKVDARMIALLTFSSFRSICYLFHSYLTLFRMDGLVVSILLCLSERWQ
jgi:hypothetical protein